MAASSSTSGSGFTPQSASSKSPSLPKLSMWGAVMATALKILGTCLRGLMKFDTALMMAPGWDLLPETIPSA